MGPIDSTTSPNVPLNDSCYTKADYQIGSAVSGVAFSTAAEFLSDWIVLIVGAYGYSYSVTSAEAFKTGKSGILTRVSPRSTRAIFRLATFGMDSLVQMFVATRGEKGEIGDAFSVLIF